MLEPAPDPMNKLPTVSVALMSALLATASAVHAQDAAAGEKKAAMCIGCHGIPGYQARDRKSVV